MRAIVDAVAASIVSEVSGAGTWTVEKFDPIWRNPGKGKTLSVYGPYLMAGDFRTTGSVEDLNQIIVEYTESAGTSAVETLTRNAAAELAAYDQADALRAWAQNHQAFPAAGVHRFDLNRVDFHPGVPRQGLVRYCRLTFEAATVAEYG